MSAMKLATAKYWRKYKSIWKIETQIDSLKWNQQDKRYVLEAKLKEANTVLENLSLAITKEEFETHLADNLCCTWEDFTGNR
jgi:hypothetical protein